MLSKRKNRAAKQEFTENMLPVDRKQMFFDCIKQRYDVILKCGLVLLIASLPLFATILYGNFAFSNLQSDAESTDRAQNAVALLQIIALIDIPCYMFLGVGFAAISRILRQLIWGEPIFFFFHLRMGIKQNCKSFLLLFFLYGFINAINTFVSTLFADNFFSFLPTIITFLFFIPIGLYMLSQSVFYANGFGKNFNNGLALYFKTAPFVWIFIALIFSFSLINLIGLLFVRIIIRSVAVLVILPLLSIAWLLYSCHVFDKFVNPQNHPEIIGKGLYRPIESEIKSK